MTTSRRTPFRTMLATLAAWAAARRGAADAAPTELKRPALGQWHTLRLVVVGDRMQAWLDGARLLDHRDARFKSGRVGLWTKADSVTAFDDLTIRGVSAA